MKTLEKVSDFVGDVYKRQSTDRADLIRFAHYMEALVAFHRYLGGKEN